jgi:hypothetical protein
VPVRDHVEGDYLGVVRDVRRTGAIVTKRATSGRAKLLGEAAWLRALPEDLRDHFPRVLAVRSGPTWAEYDMPWSPWPNLGRLLVDGRIGAADAETATRRIVEFAFARVYPRSNHPAPPDFFRRNHLEKIERRMTAVRGTSAVFDRLIDEPVLTVDGCRIESPRTVARRIAADDTLLERLTPPRVGLVHGDFKFDNFLVSRGSRDFLLLDPRGRTFSGESTGDYLEDVAKLRTSSLGLYDVVRSGHLSVRLDGARAGSTLHPAGRPAARLLAGLDAAVVSRVPEWVDERADPHWRLRLAFLTPLLLVANAPFQLTPVDERTEGIAVALYVRGAVLLHTVLDSLACR